MRYDKNNGLLTWSVLNAIISEPNSFGEIKVDKQTQKNRIDPVDAIIDAWKVWFVRNQNAKASTDDMLDDYLAIVNTKGDEKD